MIICYLQNWSTWRRGRKNLTTTRPQIRSQWSCAIPYTLPLPQLCGSHHFYFFWTHAILKCMYKRKKYESSKNKGHSKTLKYIPYWTRIHVTNSLFLPWFSGSFTIEIFNQRDVSSVKTDTFHSQTFHDAYEKKKKEEEAIQITSTDFHRGNCRNFSFSTNIWVYDLRWLDRVFSEATPPKCEHFDLCCYKSLSITTKLIIKPDGYCPWKTPSIHLTNQVWIIW